MWIAYRRRRCFLCFTACRLTYRVSQISNHILLTHVIAVFTSMCSIHSTSIVFFSLFCALENKAVPVGRRYAMPSHNNFSVPSTYCKIWKCNEQEEHGEGLIWLYQCEERWCLGERSSRCPIQVKHSPRSSASLCHIPQDFAVKEGSRKGRETGCNCNT